MPRRALTLLPTTLLAACFMQVEHREGSMPVDESFHMVVIEVETGSVALVGTDRSDAVVDYDLSYIGGCPELESYVHDGVLVIRAECPRGALSCGADLRLEVPYGVDIDAQLTTGDLSFEGVGSVRAQVTTGEIEILDAAGDLDLRTTTGDIEGGCLLADEAFARATTGSVELSLLEPFSSLEAEVTTGSIFLEVPAGCYDLDLDVVIGEVSTAGLGCDGSSDADIRARVVTGEIIVVGR